MRQLMLGVVLVCGAGFASLTQAAGVNVGVVISGEIQPGVYGRVEIGNNPRPVVVYERPVVIVSEPHRRPLEPIYLHVPPGHAKNWRKYCGRYNACARPVYFVKSAEYEPNYRREDRDDRDYDRNDNRDDDHGHDEGHGRGNSGKHKGQ